MKTIFTCLFALVTTGVAFAQTNVKIYVEHLLKDKPYALNTEASNNLSNTFELTRLQYYISKIAVIHDQGTVTEATGVYVLVDPSNPQEIDLGPLMGIDSVEGIRFHVGVNAPENNDDPSQWPVDHALAPKNPSMHWGWQAGYRFVAMEGKTGAGMNTDFQLHALGNDHYHTIQIPLTAQEVFGQWHIGLKADYTMALKDINISGGPVVHGEDAETNKMMLNFNGHVFTSTTGQGNIIASAPHLHAFKDVVVYPNPSNGKATVDFGGVENRFTQMRITDITGKVLSVQTLNSGVSSQIEISEKGVYLISLSDEKGNIFTKKLLVQ